VLLLNFVSLDIHAERGDGDDTHHGGDEPEALARPLLPICGNLVCELKVYVSSAFIIEYESIYVDANLGE
jgi:hypothetical protein